MVKMEMFKKNGSFVEYSYEPSENILAITLNNIVFSLTKLIVLF